MKNTPELIYSQYQEGRSFKSSLGKRGLYEQTRANEDFFCGNQWRNLAMGKNKPLVIYNVIKRIGEYKMSIISSSPVTCSFNADGVPNTVGLKEQAELIREELKKGADMVIDENGQPLFDANGMIPANDAEVSLMTDALGDYFDVTKERIKWDSLIEETLRNAYISGTGLIYCYWDKDIKTGLYANEEQSAPISGDVACEVLDVRNVYFGNPNTDDIQSQPYIIIEQRKTVDEVKRIAKSNGIRNTDDICSDNDLNRYWATEPTNAKNVTLLTKLWKEYDDNGNYRINGIQTTGNTIVRREWDLNIRVYPLAKMSWERRNKSIYGESEITYIIPNQIAINRMLASGTWSTMLLGMPIMAIDRNVISQEVTNAPGQVIDFTGQPEQINNAIKYFTPPPLTNNYQSMVNDLVANTQQQAGANDTALGDIRPDNTSAIIAVREVATMPLQPYKQRYYQFCEDFARILAEFWVMMYGRRSIKVEDKDGTWYMPFNGEKFKDLVLTVKVDVGASTLWSQAQALQTLDGMLAGGLLTPVEYLERLPKGIIPDLTSLIKDKKQEQEQQEQLMQQQMMQEQMMAQQSDEQRVNDAINSLSPEDRQAFDGASEDDQLAMLQQMLGGGSQ